MQFFRTYFQSELFAKTFQSFALPDADIHSHSSKARHLPHGAQSANVANPLCGKIRRPKNVVDKILAWKKKSAECNVAFAETCFI